MLPLSHAERFALGRKHRKQTPRGAHAAFKPAAHRDPLRLLAEASRGRVPALLKIKAERMATSPFAFLRGAVPVMAFDLAQLPATGLVTQLCGDAHVRNLGAFAAPDGRLVFDINDFDETIPGPFEWDVKRMAISILLAGREAGSREGAVGKAVTLFLGHYRRVIVQLAALPVVDLAHFQIHRLQQRGYLTPVLRKAERSTPLHSLTALTIEKRTRRIFRSNPPILRRLTAHEAQPVLDALHLYSRSLQPERQHFFAQYRPVDVAFKVVGTGSVGLRDYCAYFEGNESGARGRPNNDPLFLQIKEEAASAYTPYLPGAAHIGQHQGHRVVDRARAMQVKSDPFLGYTTIDSRDYLVRQLNDHKAAVDITELRGAGLLDYAAICGDLLARGHARSGDPVMLHGYIGDTPKFDKAILAFAQAYAAQTEKDWSTFKRSLRK